MKDALSALLMQAGFSVCQEPGPAGGDTTVVVDFDDCLDPEGIQARQRHGAKIVVLASEAECLTMRRDQIAPLDGLLTHALSADEWVRALGLICGGERVLPSTLGWGQDPAVPLRGPENDVRGDAHRLSPREREVLLQVVEGRPNKVIARHLHISEGTVKVHLKSLQRKIRVDNRTQAAVWALGHLPALAAQTADAA
jgi:two-component system nitrate/nitrite response regulator NarL